VGTDDARTIDGLMAAASPIRREVAVDKVAGAALKWRKK
jgi:hypothetical protein